MASKRAKKADSQPGPKRQISVALTDSEIANVDAIVARCRPLSRSSIVRLLVQLALREGLESRISVGA